ncbi:unnamed protein product [Paramecium octaurelia]|uniref:Uncharacterized protein n=1 Tax=Paramecium octaurelia TaxID=43137 RepID=A0A8S1X3Z3_PAROT|nr:unnamed protein product [Paramecium octaurelia]
MHIHERKPIMRREINQKLKLYHYNFVIQIIYVHGKSLRLLIYFQAQSTCQFSQSAGKFLNKREIYRKQCIEYIEYDYTPIQGVLKIIEEPLKQRLEEYENKLRTQFQQLKRISGNIQQLRGTILEELDDLVNRVNHFIIRLQVIGKEMANYFFFDC